MPEINTDFLFTIALEIQVSNLGDTPYGRRRTFHFDAGSFEGPKLKGTRRHAGDRHKRHIQTGEPHMVRTKRFARRVRAGNGNACRACRAARWADSKPEITKAAAVANTLTINGNDFPRGAAKVQLGSLGPLPVVSQTSSQIVVTLPAGLGGGNYVLAIDFSNKRKNGNDDDEKSDLEFIVTIGAVGPPGPKGDTGATGPQGPAGQPGAAGPQGPAGPQGATGPIGPIGPQGATGPAGPQGVTGATGPIGPIGPIGPSARKAPPAQPVPSVPSARKAPPAQPVPSVLSARKAPPARSGHRSYRPARREGRHTGATGPIGPQGPKGDTGEQGPQGIAGNLALAGQMCPDGQWVAGFDAGGNIVCKGIGGTPLSIVVEGHANVSVFCRVGDYACQAREVCEAVTGTVCVHQEYNCAGAGQVGSWYPLDGVSSGPNFNFAYTYDFAPASAGLGPDYGNICGVLVSQFPRYGVAATHTAAGRGHWVRQ